MWDRFTSSSQHKVDGKGRVSVPALFRRVLERSDTPGGLVLIPGLRGADCIEGFTHQYIDRIADAIGRMKPFSRPRRKLEYQFLANAIPMRLDDTGRIVLTRALKEAAGITSLAQFVGMGDSFQIWSPERFAAMMAEDDGDDEQDALDALPWGDAPSPPGQSA